MYYFACIFSVLLPLVVNKYVQLLGHPVYLLYDAVLLSAKMARCHINRSSAAVAERDDVDELVR